MTTSPSEKRLRRSQIVPQSATRSAFQRPVRSRMIQERLMKSMVSAEGLEPSTP